MVFFTWLILHNILSLGLSIVVSRIYIALVFIAEYYPIFWTYHISFHSPLNRHLNCFQFWVVMNNIAKNIQVHIFVHTFSFLLDIFLRVEWLDWRLSLFLTFFKRNRQLFFKMVTQFCISTINVRWFWFLDIFSNTWRWKCGILLAEDVWTQSMTFLWLKTKLERLRGSPYEERLKTLTKRAKNGAEINVYTL